jgi:hypothetical protein
MRGLASSRRALVFLICLIGCAAPGPSHADDAAPGLAALTKKIPHRQRFAISGTEFADQVSRMDEKEREQAILEQLRQGNLPEFLRSLKPVCLQCQYPDGRTITGTVFVMPDYLAIGSDDDFLRIPMNLHTAAAIASRFGFVLPTPKMVDAIYDQSAFRFKPQPMLPGPQMRSTSYYRVHDQKIKEQAQINGIAPGEFVSGHKKDVVITNRLVQKQDKIAIYGWHQFGGAPIQPLSTVHGSNYADYSHGIRLISDTVWIEGKFQSIYKVLEDPELANVLSTEGVVPNVREVLKAQSGGPPDHLSAPPGQRRNEYLITARMH